MTKQDSYAKLSFSFYNPLLRRVSCCIIYFTRVVLNVFRFTPPSLFQKTL